MKLAPIFFFLHTDPTSSVSVLFSVAGNVLENTPKILQYNQGDQIRFKKNRPKRCPSGFLTKLLLNFYGRKKKIKKLSTFVIYKTLPKVNHHPIEENSPNLVTLKTTLLEKKIVL
jgi:hypothetical protein